MDNPGGNRPQGIGHIPIGRTGRWNRGPVPSSGKSEDGRVGGGVLLTARSDSSDDILAPIKSHGTNRKGRKATLSSGSTDYNKTADKRHGVALTQTADYEKKPAGTSSYGKVSKLNVNAQPFVAGGTHTTSSKSINTDTTPTSTESAAANKQPAAKQLTDAEKADAERVKEMELAVRILMDVYNDRARTLSKEEKRIVDSACIPGTSAIQPADFRAPAQGGLTSEAQTFTAKQQFVGSSQTKQSSRQDHRPSFNPRAEAAAVPKAATYAQSAHLKSPIGIGKVKDKIASDYGPLPLPAAFQLPAGFTYTHGIMNEQANASYNNTSAPAAMLPLAPSMSRRHAQVVDNLLLTPTRVSHTQRSTLSQASANGKKSCVQLIASPIEQSMFTSQVFVGGKASVPNNQRVASPTMNVSPQYQGKHVINKVGDPSAREQAAVGYYNQNFAPHMSIAGQQYLQSQQSISRVASPTVNEQAVLGSYTQQPTISYGSNYQQASPHVLSYLSPQHQKTGIGMPSMLVGGGPKQGHEAQSGTSGHADGYNYGLPGSVSDGNMALYQANYQQGISTALVPFKTELTKLQPTVGPLEFDIPTQEIMANRSDMLQALTQKGTPNLQDILDPKYLPFTEGFKYSFPVEENGVIIIKNIPYETTRSEIIALLGKTCKILSDKLEPIHISIDRVTSKTLDAFCELTSLDAAIEMVEKFKKNAENGRITRLGARIVDVELSSQTNLMLSLFPSTRYGVNWIGARPEIVQKAKWSWENFRGFFTVEEMIMLTKHIENSQRSLYARICPERPYECMISTIRKIPWYKAEHITIKQRHALYDACAKMIETLSTKINRVGNVERAESQRLTPQLLNRLVISAMLCPGFSVVQKHNLACLAGVTQSKARDFNQPPHAESWRHLWTLIPKAGMPIDVLEWYIAVIREETNRVVQGLDISRRMPLQGMMQGLDGYWGFFWAEANFPVGPAWDNLSLAECGRMEWLAIERILIRAVQGGNVPASYLSGIHTNEH